MRTGSPNQQPVPVTQSARTSWLKRWRHGQAWLYALLIGLLVLTACGEANAATTSTATPVSSTATRGSAPTTTGSPTVADDTAVVSYNENAGGGGGKNIVHVVNQTDNRLRVRGSIQLNRIPGPTVEPVNLASAWASCTDCETIAVALQINLISRTANRVTPQNAAVAVNERCTRCITVARALQYTYSVDDPTQVPPEVSALIREMDRTLKEIGTDRNISISEAEARINAVIAQFRELATSLDDQRDEATDGTSAGTPTPSANPTPTGVPTPTPTSPPSPTSTPAITPTPTTQPRPSPSPTSSP